jgi:hypothetical protein
MNYEKCPKCGNEKIVQWTEETLSREYSVRTGKCLKSMGGSTVCWGFKCKCGWESETFTQ